MDSHQERLNRVIPGGAHTYSRGADQFPATAPCILSHGKGAYVWDQDGQRFLDYGMSLRAVTLGYANERVNRAAWHQIERGNNLTRPSTVELEAAELLVDLIPSAEMVKFAKNGSNVTTAAIKVARAFTGRERVCFPRQQPFFSFDDWFIGSTEMNLGVPRDGRQLTMAFDYGDIATLEALFEQHPEEIACVIMEAATSLAPCDSRCSTVLTSESACGSCTFARHNFARQVQSLCRKYGALFILDEMITGFRWHLQGAAHYFGLQPDLLTFGKGMANGFSVAALCGRRDIMELGSTNRAGAERLFLLSSTHGGEMSSLGAFIETVQVYEDEEVVSHLWTYGRRLREGLQAVACETDSARLFEVLGPDISLTYVVKDASGELSLPLRTLFAQEMSRRGVLFPWIAVSLAHDDSTLAATLDAAFDALSVVRQACEGSVQDYLQGPPMKPVFRRFN